MIIQSTREATREELIQRIKDLEEENKYLRDENAIYRNETISKSVIRNKIDFYKRYGKIENINEYVMSVEIEVLKDLLGE